MFEVTTRVEILRPPDIVFAFVADHTNAPRWQTGLHEVRRLTDGPLGVGTEHEFVRRFAGRELAARNRFVEFEAGRYVRFEIPEGWITGHASYLAEPVGAGATQLISRAELRARGPMRALEPALARLFDRESRRDEARLKTLLEADATAPA